MSFFHSDIVKGDIQEMLELQQFCFRSAMNFVLLDTDRKKDYFEALEKLIEKQKIFYARAKLSEDPEAKSVVETMKQGVIMLGATPDTPIEQMFDELLQKVERMKQQLEAGG
jgi:MinD-like ATPase involved in chromosome partitioning or flagellar assembly|tara:strand:- start:14 stop:349 length:336 start_codon:yes stop_codon:yes gene_type:complete